MKGVESQNFTEWGAIKFICTLGAAEQDKEVITWRNHLSKATNGNPLLLCFYECAGTDGYDKGYRLVKDQLLKIVDNLLTLMPREVYQVFIEQLFTWLTYAIEERHNPKSEEDRNWRNYLLLIQVSLSNYANHKSKALDIHANVVSVEYNNDGVKSIGEY